MSYRPTMNFKFCLMHVYSLEHDKTARYPASPKTLSICRYWKMAPFALCWITRYNLSSRPQRWVITHTIRVINSFGREARLRSSSISIQKLIRPCWKSSIGLNVEGELYGNSNIRYKVSKWKSQVKWLIRLWPIGFLAQSQSSWALELWNHATNPIRWAFQQLGNNFTQRIQ